MAERMQEITRDELLCIIGALDYVICAGENETTRMSESEITTFEELKSARVKIGTLLGISPEQLVELHEKCRVRFRE